MACFGFLLALAWLLPLLPQQTYHSGATLPSPRYLEHPPQYFPKSPPFPLSRELAAQERASAAAAGNVGGPPPRPPGNAASGAPLSGTQTAPVSPAQMGPAPLPPPGGGVVQGFVSPAPPASPPPTPLPPPSPRPLAVANVHKEPVTLFKVVNGELTFVQKLSAGEAVDLRVLPGEKLSATFASAPHCANYTVKSVEGEVWLLRPSPEVPTPVRPTPSCGALSPAQPAIPPTACMPQPAYWPAPVSPTSR